MLGQMMTLPLTISRIITHAGKYHGETEIVSVETDGSTAITNWRETELRARKLASALGKLGLEPGARCGTIAWNNYRHLDIYYGVAGAGLICHTINPRLFPEQHVFVTNHAEDQVLFFDLTFLPLIKALKAKFETVKHYVLMGPRNEEAASEVDGLLFYDELIETGDADYVWPELTEDTASSLCYTSGTTGNPKGVLYSHRSTVLHSLNICMADSLAMSARDCVMPVVPMFHVNAWGIPYAAGMSGCKLVLPGPGLDGESLLNLIMTHKINIALGVPTIWQGLLAAIRKAGLSELPMKRTVIGGAAAPPAMIHAYAEVGVEVIHAWGMTETSPVGTVNHLLEKHQHLSPDEQMNIRECQGRPPFGVELKLVDDDGAPLAEDGETQGRLLIRGDWIVQDYFNTDVQTLTEDGWFDTGDIATIDGDGFMTIRDRSKDIIKSGGEWISTVELENIAMSHPKIREAAAIAARHPKWDERPVLLAVREGEDVAEDEMIAFYDGKVASWQVPDRVIFIDALPRNATGKVLKNTLRDEYGGVLEG
ncbi:long-chain-fatty-acid--CoA ligase [Paracoccaceae bacterium GXU_MW_L88]